MNRIVLNHADELPSESPFPDLVGDDVPMEECGVVGMNSKTNDASRTVYYGLFSLQHRGQEAAGMAACECRGQTRDKAPRIKLKKGLGLIPQVFSEADIGGLKGSMAIGHTRYSTTGSSDVKNAQPFLIDTCHGPIALAHNGNLVNAPELRGYLLRKGVGLSSASDTEIMIMTLAGADGSDWAERIGNAMKSWVGAFSFVLLSREGVFAARDPWGMRPLSFGTLPDGGMVAASETCALSTLGCVDQREVPAGSVVRLGFDGSVDIREIASAEPKAPCIFEYVYFSRPDSMWNGTGIHEARRRFGEALARTQPVPADLVVPVPDSSISAAIGYARAAGIPYGEAFVKNRYIGRTFIEPTQTLREKGVALKFNVLPDAVAGKRIIVIDDSIVRGTTIKPLVAMLKGAGAKEVHIRVASPPVLHPCYMGVDMGSEEELVAIRKNEKEFAEDCGADSLAYLRLSEVEKAVGSAMSFCTACFSGSYPFPVDGREAKESFEF
jgi:amidophosphoribosyltransferase